MSTAIADRIERLHRWYCDNALRLPLTPEVQRLWFTFFKQGYNGKQLALVIRYLGVMIRRDKRQAGALKLSNLLEQTEEGMLLKFAEDLALAEQWQHGGRRPATPLPEGESDEVSPASQSPATPAASAPKITPETALQHLAALEALKRRI